MMRRLSICTILTMAALAVMAQGRIPCDRGAWGGSERAATRGPVYASSVSSLLGSYHVPVVLAAFKDVPFTVENVKQEWDAMLNQQGFSKNGAAGCVSEYFKKQSGGRFNITFDLIGPVNLPDSMKYYGENQSGSSGEDMRPEQMIVDACQGADTDFSPYDWDGDGTIDVVLVIFSGHGENRGGTPDAIWPHKYNIYGKKVGELSLRTYACVSELGSSDAIDGYGTLCHEFSHTLGLPDLYPISGSAYSIFDEWDLMDGGNYANKCWSVPNYSAFERNICGWYEPVELSEATTISAMPAIDDEMVAYIIRNNDDPKDYYIVENRQQRGWDAYVPGNGLLITHVDHYDGSLAPNDSYKTQVGLVFADNRTYRESEAFFGKTYSQKYTADGHNRYLSLAAYPYIVGDSINDFLSEYSIPAMTFSKPITNIRMASDGTISFDFMKGSVAISSASRDTDSTPVAWYDLNGRQLPAPPSQRGLYIVRYANGNTRKLIK